MEVLSGTEVTLTCKYSAFPEADVKWTVLDEEGDPLPDAGYKIVDSSLVLMALQPSDSAQYVCSVTNIAGTASASTRLKVVGKHFFVLVFPNNSYFVFPFYLRQRGQRWGMQKLLHSTPRQQTCLLIWNKVFFLENKK